MPRGVSVNIDGPTCIRTTVGGQVGGEAKPKRVIMPTGVQKLEFQQKLNKEEGCRIATTGLQPERGLGTSSPVDRYPPARFGSISTKQI